MKNKVFFVLTIIWMEIIFSFSARPADVSTEDSYAVGLKIGSVFVSGFDELSEEEQLAFAAKIDHPVRKTAHGLEYAVLGILVINAGYSFFLKRLGNRRLVSFLLCWFICVLYACSDEFHQLFVPGRSGQISDVCLDSFGAFVGCFICFLWIFCYYKTRKKIRK